MLLAKLMSLTKAVVEGAGDELADPEDRKRGLLDALDLIRDPDATINLITYLSRCLSILLSRCLLIL